MEKCFELSNVGGMKIYVRIKIHVMDMSNTYV